MKTPRWCGPIGLTVLALVLAGRAGAAVDYARDGGPVEFGAAELEAALRGRAAQTRVGLTVAGGGAPESFRVRVRGEGAARERQQAGVAGMTPPQKLRRNTILLMAGRRADW